VRVRSVFSMTSATFAPISPVTVVDAMRSEMAELGELLWAAKPPMQLLETVAGIEKLRSLMDAVELKVIEEIEATDAAKVDGWASTKDFVTAITGGHRGSGASAVRLAHAVATDRGRVGEELANGRISRAQAQVIVTTIDGLPTRAGLREAAEEAMIEAAHTRDATELANAGKYLIARLDPDGDERKTEQQLAREERAAHLSRHLSITADGVGGVRIKGRATIEDAAIIKTALFPLAAPEPSDPGACGGHPGDRSSDCAGASGCAHDGRDPRDHGARFVDALVEGCRRLLATNAVPDSHGAPARLTLTMAYTDLVEEIGTATLDTGETVCASTVRRLACDADLIPMVLGSHGEILDVGRLNRLVTTVIWIALVVRDRHCTFPGCRRPSIACDAHHITHWLDGGSTSLDNLALLCRTHHMMIHNTPWQIRLNLIDKRPEFIPPLRLDPEQKPIRNRRPRE